MSKLVKLTLKSNTHNPFPLYLIKLEFEKLAQNTIFRHYEPSASLHESE